MKVETANLTGKQLDAAVALCTPGAEIYLHHYKCIDPVDPAWAVRWKDTGTWTELSNIAASSDWGVGGPIIERERMLIKNAGRVWVSYDYGQGYFSYGPNPLTAAMRCYVKSKLGDTIELPEGL